MLAGIDIVQISRMVEVVEKSDERLERLFHLGKLPTAAAREGARRRLSPDITRLKRLFLKHWGRASAREPGEMWKYAMISGGAFFKLYGYYASEAKDRSPRPPALSISHDGDYAVAQVIWES